MFRPPIQKPAQPVSPQQRTQYEALARALMGGQQQPLKPGYTPPQGLGPMFNGAFQRRY